MCRRLRWSVCIAVCSIAVAGDPHMCSGERSPVHLSTAVFFQFIRSYKLPSAPRVSTQRSLPETPLTFSTRVDEAGEPYELRLVHEADSSIADPLASAIRQWRFSPPTVNGRRVCTESTVFVYVRRVADRIEFVVPYLTDRGGKQPELGRISVSRITR